MEIFKIDITSAFLNTPMKDDVDHKWLLLDKDVALFLMSMDSEYWKGFLRRDGKILVKLDKIMYGFKEAAYWWNVMLVKFFVDNGYRQLSKDQCVLVKSEGNKVSYCVIAVDDCLFAMSKDPDWINQSVEMLKAAFEELTVEQGETINILGMTVYMDRENGKAVINQQHFLDKLRSTYGITRTAFTTTTGDLITSALKVDY